MKPAEKKRRRRWIIILIVTVLVIVLAAAGFYIYTKLRVYTGYEVLSSYDLNYSTENISVREFANGYVECSSGGITYFTKNGPVWSESFEMNMPLMDICEGYIAVADMKQSDVYLFDKSGPAGRVTSSHAITDVEVSRAGVTAVITDNGSSSFIEIRDREGNELINIKNNFSSSGYPMDIALSSDGTKLAAAFLYVSQGSFGSKVLFYDFSEGRGSDNALIKTFDQYTDTVLTDIEFMGGSTLCAVGDDALTFYRLTGSDPQIISEELNMDWEVQSLLITNEYLLFITKSSSDEANYTARIYNTSGEAVTDINFDLPYSNACIAGKHLMIYSASAAQMFDFDSRLKFSHSFSERTEYMYPSGGYPSYILVTGGDTQFIALK